MVNVVVLQSIHNTSRESAKCNCIRKLTGTNDEPKMRERRMDQRHCQGERLYSCMCAA